MLFFSKLIVKAEIQREFRYNQISETSTLTRWLEQFTRNSFQQDSFEDAGAIP